MTDAPERDAELGVNSYEFKYDGARFTEEQRRLQVDLYRRLAMSANDIKATNP